MNTKIQSMVSFALSLNAADQVAYLKTLNLSERFFVEQGLRAKPAFVRPPTQEVKRATLDAVPLPPNWKWRAESESEMVPDPWTVKRYEGDDVTGFSSIMPVHVRAKMVNFNMLCEGRVLKGSELRRVDYEQYWPTKVALVTPNISRSLMPTLLRDFREQGSLKAAKKLAKKAKIGEEKALAYRSSALKALQYLETYGPKSKATKAYNKAYGEALFHTPEPKTECETLLSRIRATEAFLSHCPTSGVYRETYLEHKSALRSLNRELTVLKVEPTPKAEGAILHLAGKTVIPLRVSFAEVMR